MKRLHRFESRLSCLFFLLVALPATAQDEAEAPEPVDVPAVAVKFTLPEHALYPESLAYDPKTERYFLSSLGQSRILCLEKDGTRRDLPLPPGVELASSVGMKVDAGRRRLWVCHGRYVLHEKHDELPARTGVLVLDLDEPRVVRSWSFVQKSDYHIFNDLALAADGTAYATTTLMGKVYHLDAESGEAEVILDLGDEGHNNGIALDPEGRTLFLVTGRMLSRLDLATRELAKLTLPPGEGPGGDGLYFYDGSLLVVLPHAKRIARYFLNEARTAATRAETLVAGRSDWDYPTTGLLLGDELLVVATSYASGFQRAEGTEQHGDVSICSVPLQSE